MAKKITLNIAENVVLGVAQMGIYFAWPPMDYIIFVWYKGRRTINIEKVTEVK